MLYRHPAWYNENQNVFILLCHSTFLLCFSTFLLCHSTFLLWHPTFLCCFLLCLIVLFNLFIVSIPIFIVSITLYVNWQHGDNKIFFFVFFNFFYCVFQLFFCVIQRPPFFSYSTDSLAGKIRKFTRRYTFKGEMSNLCL